MKREILNSNSEAETREIARNFAKYCKKGGVIALYGNLGAGKTLFSKSLISEACSSETNVTSPTFNIVQTYDASSGVKIYHFDLYRLKDINEAEDIGIEDAFQYGFSIIEWPELISHLLPKGTIHIKLTRAKNPNLRLIEIVNT